MRGLARPVPQRALLWRLQAWVLVKRPVLLRAVLRALLRERLPWSLRLPRP